MDEQRKPDIITGSTDEPTPILADEKRGTAARSKNAQAKNESASIEIASILALLQTDFSDLQSKGLRVVILARENKLYASIEFTGHVLGITDTGRKSITLDGKNVAEYE